MGSVLHGLLHQGLLSSRVCVVAATIYGPCYVLRYRRIMYSMQIRGRGVLDLISVLDVFDCIVLSIQKYVLD